MAVEALVGGSVDDALVDDVLVALSEDVHAEAMVAGEADRASGVAFEAVIGAGGVGEEEEEGEDEKGWRGRGHFLTNMKILGMI